MSPLDVHPSDSPEAQSFLAELEGGVREAELVSILDANSADDRALSLEQYTLAQVVADACTPDTPSTATHAAMKKVTDPHSLVAPAKAALNRLMNDPTAAIWSGWDDGGIAVRRHCSFVRARLHRLERTVQ